MTRKIPSMWLTLMLSALLVVVAGRCRSSRFNQRVVGGSSATSSEFPSMAVIIFSTGGGSMKDFIACGGSIIGDRYILTAGECLSQLLVLQKEIPNSKLQVKVGCDNLDRCANVFQVADHKLHPKAQAGSMSAEYNLAILKTDRPVYNPYDNVGGVRIGPITLVNDTVSDYAPGEQLFIAGYGSANPKREDERSSQLMKTSMRAISADQCMMVYKGYYSPKNMCATSETSNVCAGDSGGPLIRVGPSGAQELVGVIGGTLAACEFKDGAIFMRVSQHQGWIQDTMRNWPTTRCSRPRNYFRRRRFRGF